MHRLDALAAQIFFELQIEVGGVHADKKARLINGQALEELLADAHNFAVAQQHVPAKTMHRQFVVRPPGLKPLRCHARPANACRHQSRPACAQRLQQQAGQQITRGFSSHHGQGPRRLGVSRRCWYWL